MNDRDIKRKLKQEAEQMMPDVLASVYQKLNLAPKAKKRSRFFGIPAWGMLATGSLAGLVVALVLTSIDNSPIVSEAETAIKIQMVAASIATSGDDPLQDIKYANPDVEVPTFSYKIDERGKTIALDNKKNNALFAENEPARVIAGGLSLSATLRRNPVDLALDLTRLARQAGYFESYEIGNIVRFRLIGEDEQYITQLRTQLQTSIDTYFRNELIYGVALEDLLLEEPNFGNYSDFSSNMSQYNSEFDNRRNNHASDDDRRGSNWGEDIDEWMDSHRDHHGTGTSSTSSSESDDHRPSSIPGSGHGHKR
jgi:hypothetical protein